MHRLVSAARRRPQHQDAACNNRRRAGARPVPRPLDPVARVSHTLVSMYKLITTPAAATLSKAVLLSLLHHPRPSPDTQSNPATTTATASSNNQLPVRTISREAAVDRRLLHSQPRRRQSCGISWLRDQRQVTASAVSRTISSRRIMSSMTYSGIC